MKNLYLFALLVLLSAAMVSETYAFQSGSVENQEDAPAGATAQEENDPVVGNQKQYTETDITGDGIKNSRQDPEESDDEEPADDEDGDTEEPTTDQKKEQERAHQEDQSGEQPKAQERERVQEKLHTQEQDIASTLAEMKRLVEQIRKAMQKLYRWN